MMWRLLSLDCQGGESRRRNRRASSWRLIKKVPARKDAVAIDDAILEVYCSQPVSEAANNSVSVGDQFEADLPRVQGSGPAATGTVNLIINAIEAIRDGSAKRSGNCSSAAVTNRMTCHRGAMIMVPGFTPAILTACSKAFYATTDGLWLVCRSVR